MNVVLSANRDLRARQAGMTTLGMILLVVFVGMFAFAGLRLTPIYLNYMKIAGAIDGVKDEFDSKGASRAAIRSSLSRRFDIESVGVIKANDVKISAVDSGFEVHAEYDHITPFIGPVSFSVHFDKATVIRR